jgi:hypothetical protein
VAAQYLGIPWEMSALFLLMWLAAALLPLREAEGDGAAAERKRSFKKHLFYSVAIMAPFVPLLILLHEVGHYLTARSFGYEATFTYAEIVIRAKRMLVTEAIAVTAAGPLVELTFAIVGMAGLWWRYSRWTGRRAEPGLWIFTAFCVSGLRWLRMDFTGASSDEARLTALLGVPRYSLPAILIPVAVLSAAVMIWTHRRQRTLVPLAAGFTVAALSAVLWLTWLGPILFPHPWKQSWKQTPHSGAQE